MRGTATRLARLHARHRHAPGPSLRGPAGPARLASIARHAPAAPRL